MLHVVCYVQVWQIIRIGKFFFINPVSVAENCSSSYRGPSAIVSNITCQHGDKKSNVSPQNGHGEFIMHRWKKDSHYYSQIADELS